MLYPKTTSLPPRELVCPAHYMFSRNQKHTLTPIIQYGNNENTCYNKHIDSCVQEFWKYLDTMYGSHESHVVYGLCGPAQSFITHQHNNKSGGGSIIPLSNHILDSQNYDIPAHAFTVLLDKETCYLIDPTFSQFNALELHDDLDNNPITIMLSKDQGSALAQQLLQYGYSAMTNDQWEIYGQSLGIASIKNSYSDYFASLLHNPEYEDDFNLIASQTAENIKLLFAYNMSNEFKSYK